MIIPEGVTEIGQLAFGNCASLKTLVLPASVETISAAAFSNCSSLTSVKFLGGSVERIGSRAFFACSRLDRVEHRGLLESGCTVDEMAFRGCTALEARAVAYYRQKEEEEDCQEEDCQNRSAVIDYLEAYNSSVHSRLLVLLSLFRLRASLEAAAPQSADLAAVLGEPGRGAGELDNLKFAEAVFLKGGDFVPRRVLEYI